MRVLHLVNKLSNRGNGIVNLAVDLAIEERQLGHTVAFAAGYGGGYEPLLRTHGVAIHTVEQARSAAKLLAASLALRRLLREFKPDIVHAHMQTGLLLAVPWTKVYRIPLVAHLHNIHDSGVRRMGVADRLITVSAAVAKSMEQQGVPQAKLRTVLNATIGSFRVPPLKDLAPATLLRPAVLSVCGMNYRKGVAELLTAFESVAAKIPEAHLYLVGDGPDRAAFESQAASSAAADRIHFLGFTPTPQQFMLSTDVFVLASRRDSFGLVLAEAREAGCAIIGSDVDGIPEALDGGRAGILVPPVSPEALAEQMLALLSDEVLRRQWQKRAKAGVERFTVARMTNEVLSVYGELLPATGGRSAGLQDGAR